MENLHKAPYHSLSSMAEYELKKSIHFIVFNPFSIIYSTPLQRKWYRTQTTVDRRIVSIDASSVNVIPPKGSRVSENGQPKHQTVFLCVIMLRGIVPVPVGVMLSQDHTMRFISFWLSGWNNINYIGSIRCYVWSMCSNIHKFEEYKCVHISIHG